MRCRWKPVEKGVAEGKAYLITRCTTCGKERAAIGAPLPPPEHCPLKERAR